VWTGHYRVGAGEKTAVQTVYRVVVFLWGGPEEEEDEYEAAKPGFGGLNFMI